ncbi:MAG TPA: metallophosphoesterase [Solirubrobacteraceae bacterium]|nr:metallophosphoesterase [Solirubrobacteraceae bacterium]
MRYATVLLLLVALAGCGADARTSSSPSTVQGTLVDRDGDGFLEPGPGEPLGGTRVPLGRTLATFGQLTDTHVRDEESPARVPFLDRIGPPVSSTFRPQEAFSTQVLCAAVRALNRERPQAVVVTGDIVDSAQENELDQALAVLDGGVVDPDSGDPGYDGVQAASNPDPFYFRPDNDAPRHPGVLDAAQRRFRTEGLRAPWFPALGNHDVLVQGEVPATPEIERIATGDRMVVGIDPESVPPLDEDSAPAAVNALLAQGDVFGRSETVPADPRRRHMRPSEMVARLADAAGVPATGDRLDYAFDIGPSARGIVLDTVDRSGGSDGVLTAAQLAWLRDELAAGDRWIVLFAHNALPEPALELLDRTPRVAAVVRGNSHRNAIAPRDGYWLISTSSLADFPQQARMFRLREAPGGAVLETWMVDHDGHGLAGVARELAYLDAQGGRPQEFAGRPTDRNMRLFVQP